jgi:hypothetical protein
MLSGVVNIADMVKIWWFYLRLHCCMFFYQIKTENISIMEYLELKSIVGTAVSIVGTFVAA